LFALLWLALCLAVCFTPSASLSRAALEEQRVAGALSLSKALAPADERLASLRRVSRAENDPSHHSPDSAPLTAFTAPLLLLPAWQGFALPRTIALAARHHPGAPRAPPLAQPFAV
jgi:hypothetical protein